MEKNGVIFVNIAITAVRYNTCSINIIQFRTLL